MLGLGLGLNKGLSIASRTDWTPRKLNLALWLDASDESTITENDGTVSQWDDKSGNDRHASQTAAGSQPSFVVNNGKPALEFDGISNYLQLQGFNSVNTAEPFTYVAVFLSRVENGSSGFILAQNYGGSDREPVMVVVNNARQGGTDSIGISAYLQYRTDGTFRGKAIDEISNNELLIATGGWTGSTMEFYVNGVSGERNTSNEPDVSPPNMTDFNLRIGQRANETPNHFEGLIQEVIILPNYHTEEERLKLEGYLAWKWDMVDSLPQAHPYKLSPPRA